VRDKPESRSALSAAFGARIVEVFLLTEGGGETIMAGVGGVPLGDFSKAEYEKIKQAQLRQLRADYRADARGEGRER